MASLSGSKLVINLNHRLQSVGAKFLGAANGSYRVKFGSCPRVGINKCKPISSSQFRKFILKLNMFNELIVCPAQLVQ